MVDMKYKISDIYVNSTILKKLEKRKEELVHYYGEREIKNSMSLLNLLPKRIINVTHKLPLKILAFSDYHIQDFKPLLQYVKNLKENPDIIGYAGDAVDRFGSLPLKMLILKNLKMINLKRDKGELYPSMFDIACFFYEEMHEDSGVVERRCSKRYGFILRMPKKLKINVKEKLNQIINVYSKIQNFKNISKSFQTFKSLIRDLPVRIEETKLKEIHASENSLSRIINLVDTQTQLKIYSINMKGEELFYSPSIYDDFYEIYKNVDFYKIPINKLKSDKKYIYYFIPNPELPGKNVFEELGENSRYGVVAVLGNNDFISSKTLINGKNAFDAFSTLIKIGPILIIGIEGEPSDIGVGMRLEYLESDYKLRLEFIQKYVAKDEFIIIVSHPPPKGILDRAIRFGERSIGSVALRDYIEEDPRVGLVICGHVHNQGGKFEVLNNTTVVNVSSQDTPFDKANVAWITIDEDKKVHIKIEKLPSLIEQIFKEDRRTIKENLINKVKRLI
jgi:Icc-related predicted phosphoesterase